MQITSNSPSKVMICDDADANFIEFPKQSYDMLNMLWCWCQLYQIPQAKLWYVMMLMQIKSNSPSNAGWWFQPLSKNISQWEGLSHIFWKITNVWNHQPECYDMLWCWCWFLLVRIAGFNLAPCSLGRKTNQSTDTTQVPWQVIRHVRGLFQQEALSMFFHPGRVPGTNYWDRVCPQVLVGWHPHLDRVARFPVKFLLVSVMGSKDPWFPLTNCLARHYIYPKEPLSKTKIHNSS